MHTETVCLGATVVSYWTAAVSHFLVSSTVRFRLLVAEDTCVCGAAESIHLATSLFRGTASQPSLLEL